MSLRYILLTTPLRFLSSSKLALVLVLVVILFSLAGAILPQEGMIESKDIAAWQKEHPILTGALEPAGFFHVFHSWPFLVTIVVLGINTLTCTVLHFVKDGGLSALNGPRGIEKAGFFLLHISLIVLFAGGFWSAATKLDGYIVLTEGQPFIERHNSYVRLVEGPLRREHHKKFVVALKRVVTKYEKQRYLTDVTSNLEILSEGKRATNGTVKFNKPFTYKGLSFTQAET
ncbi:MAG: cytochrome c biogenesis protein ResB [Planctomycetota bacterium]|jgi:cytochrome c biogenesis protein ResB